MDATHRDTKREREIIKVIIFYDKVELTTINLERILCQDWGGWYLFGAIFLT